MPNIETSRRHDIRRIVLPLSLLLAVAGLLRAYAWSHTAVIFNDGPVFLALAEAIANGRWAEVLTHPYHPLYPLCIALVSMTGLDMVHSGVAVSIFGGLLGIVGLYALLRQMWGRGVAWSGAWVLALHPWALDFSSDVMSDGLYTGLFLIGFAAMSRMVEKPGWKASLSCGVFSSLAFLVRPEGLGLVPIAFLLVGGRMLLGKSPRASSLRSLAALLLAAGVVVAPYVWVLSNEAGQLTWTQKKSLGGLVQGDASVASSTAISLGRARISPPLWLPQSASPIGAGQPARNWAGAFEAVTRVIRTSAASFRYELLVFVLVGCWAVRNRPGRGWRACVLALPLLVYSMLLVLLVWGAGYISRRHALAAWLPLIGLAVLGWHRIWDRVRVEWKRMKNNAPTPSVSTRPGAHWVALVVILALAWGPRDLRERRADREALRLAAEWLAEVHPSSGRIAAEKLRTAYYAQAAYVPLPRHLRAGLEQTLRAEGARWIVIDADRLERIQGLVEGVDDWLIPVHRVDRHDHSALVYRID